ncbi:MAG: NAD(P)/FAD-dependent oxidoreductase [Lactobacillaceae bacterium]|jgi:thioredoxin reductase (NADPH)|nr:NAD(P)/FAD-dependent oxidoreductase [Lactobacillaceae bacterium]
MTEMKQTDVVIIGAGPVGMFAAFYSGLRELNVTIIESLKTVGGQTSNLYPQKQILDIPGFVKTTGSELIEQLKAQMEQFNHDLRLDTTVTDVRQTADGFEIITSQDEHLLAKAVIVATGKGAFNPRKLPLEVWDGLEEEGVHYFLNDLEDFRDQRVLVAGGGDSAVDMATLLTDVAKEVHLTHRRDNFRAMEHAVTALEQSSVIKQTPYNIDKITKNADGSLDVELTMARGDEQKLLNVDSMMVNYGFLSENKIVAGWSIQPVVERQKFTVKQTMETTIPGVFAVGDVAGYENKAELIATGFGEVPTAVNAIIAKYFPDHQGVVHSSGLTIKDGKIG